MECRLETKLKAMIEGLAREHQRELAEAGTLVELEELTCQIGDMVTRELTQREVSRRAEALDVEEAKCPDCGESCGRGEREPVVLDGLRGELAYSQPSYFCRHCRRSFFPMAASLGLAARSTVTPSVLQKMVWAGSNLGSYTAAEEAFGELVGVSISARRIRRAVEQIGAERVAERQVGVERFKEMAIPQQLVGSRAVEPPEIGVISMDGGRYQRREHFGQEDRPPGHNHWREDKVGCLLSMVGCLRESDPTPELPEWLATSSAVAELAKVPEKTGVSEPADGLSGPSSHTTGEGMYEPPELVSREVLASGDDADSFGWQLAARAWQRGFSAAGRLAFVADGAHENWTIQQKHFGRATPILDLMHALSYAYSAAEAAGDETAYPRWARWIWQGEIHRVIAALRDAQHQIGKPPAEVSPNDPRQRVHRALVYYQNHRSRMNYPEYRRLGLPLTSSHIESTIKQINRRVKGSEKFWSRSTSEGVLQLRADCLSHSAPLDAFWLRHQARQTGSNAYNQAT